MVGERLKRARNNMKLSLRDLAEKVNLSQTTISKYEKGISKPNSTILIKLAKILNVNENYFFKEETIELKNKEYRKRETSSIQLASIESKILNQIENRFFIESLFPQKDITNFQIPDVKFPEIKYLKDIPEISKRIREVWKINDEPISDLCELLESKGIKVFMINEPKESSFDGMTAVVNGYHIIVLSSDWPGDRQRFTLSHELGHLILKNKLPTSLKEKEEKACDYFAGSFLLPSVPLKKKLGDKRRSLEIAELSLLKKEFGVSMQAVFIRAAQEGIISYQTSKSIWDYFEKQNWTKQEPGEQYPSEKIYIYDQLVMRALSEGFIENSKAAELLGLNMRTFNRFRKGF